MKKVLLLLALLSFSFNGYSQFSKSIIKPFTVKIKYKNGNKIKHILYDIGDNELFLIKEDSKLLENHLDSLSIINIKFTNDIEKLVIRRLTTISSPIFKGYFEEQYPTNLFIFGKVNSFDYNSRDFFVGETVHSFELEDGLPDKGLYKYCLKRQLENLRF